MFTIISRILHYGFKNFVRNALLSTATVAIVTLSLVVFAGLIVANTAADNAVAFLEDKFAIQFRPQELKRSNFATLLTVNKLVQAKKKRLAKP